MRQNSLLPLLAGTLTKFLSLYLDGVANKSSMTLGAEELVENFRGKS